MEPQPSVAGEVPLDRQYLSTVSGDDHEFERELAESFLQASPEALSRLRAGIDRGDAKAVREAAHALKGSSRAIGAEPMSAVCEAMEHRARDGDLSDAPSRLEQIEGRYHALAAFIRVTWKV